MSSMTDALCRVSRTSTSAQASIPAVAAASPEGAQRPRDVHVSAGAQPRAPGAQSAVHRPVRQ
jgi:hypothetical protein